MPTLVSEGVSPTVRDAHDECISCCDEMLLARRAGDQTTEATHALRALLYARFALQRALAVGVSPATVSILTKQRDALWADVARLAGSTP